MTDYSTLNEMTAMAAFQEGHCMRLQSILNKVRFNDWKFKLRVPHPFTVQHTPFLQIEVDGKDNASGAALSWKGRKWQLSYHMTETEVVRTAFKAVQAAQEHELAEQFKYKGIAPFDPHLKIDHLVEIAQRNDLDKRVDNR